MLRGNGGGQNALRHRRSANRPAAMAEHKPPRGIGGA